jgi:mono/diheme cytochrome c family protein
MFLASDQRFQMLRNTALRAKCRRDVGALRLRKVQAAVIVGMIALTAAGVAQATESATPATHAAKAEGIEPLVEQGRRLALAADCASCHSAPGGKPYAGGAALNSPFGKIYPPNVTPDPKTGIGTWTAADFEGALRRGVAKNGEALYPAMPYDHYTLMSDADIAALWAFMRSLPPVSQKAPPNTLPFPLNLRAGMTVWQAAFFKPGRYTPVEGKSVDWNRGAYLVEGPGHCGACHTPRNLAQASQSAKRLGGAKVEGWYAPDISNDPLSKLSGYSTDSLQRFLKTGRSPHNTIAIGGMRQVVHDSLSQLPDSDLHAMAVYLKDQPTDTRSAGAVHDSVLPERLATGKALYEDQCSTCHGLDGKGVNGGVPALAGNNGVTAREPNNVVSAMLEGFEPNGSYGAMASFATVLTDQQIADVANYVRSAWGNQAGRAASGWSVSRLRSLAQPSAEAGRAALLCPALPGAVLQPALDLGSAALHQAASDTAEMKSLVHRYRAQRPKATQSQVIEALSTAYCRSVVADGAKLAGAGARVADFSQQVASVLVLDTATAGKPSRPIPH